MAVSGVSGHAKTPFRPAHICLWGAALLAVMLLAACTTAPRVTANESSAYVMLPVRHSGIRDARGEFRNIFCEVLQARRAQGYTAGSCEEHLLRLSDEPVQPAAPVDLDASTGAITVVFVAGFASDCVDQANQAKSQFLDYLARFGYHFETLRVSGISSSAGNARQIRDAFAQRPELGSSRKVVIVAHSKGVVDVLEALVRYPELRPRITAVVSLAGAIGGSPLANVAPDLALSVARNTPGLQCRDGDGGALESLRPQVRRDWLAENTLPADVALYSIVTLPTPERISTGLKPAYDVLSDFDSRNDGNLLFYDQVIPRSTLLGYVNADHWAISTDLGKSPYGLVRALADKSEFPREALLEAVLRFIERDLEQDRFRACTSGAEFSFSH